MVCFFMFITEFELMLLYKCSVLRRQLVFRYKSKYKKAGVLYCQSVDRFQTYIFCSKVSSKCRKCRFRDPNLKKIHGGMPLDPPTIVSSLWPPPH